MALQTLLPPSIGTIPALGGVVNGVLEISDGFADGSNAYYYEDYLLTGALADAPIRIVLEAAFSPYLEVLDSSSLEIVDWFRENYAQDSIALTFIPRADKNYRLRISGDDKNSLGPFNLRTLPLETPAITGTIPSLNGALTSALDASDRLNPVRPGCYSEDFLLSNLVPGTPVKVSLVADFDAYLQIINAETQDVVAWDDEGGSGSNALLIFTPLPGITYLARATSYEQGETGPFTLRTLPVNDPDLKLIAATAPTSGTVGERITMSWTVENVGASAASGGWDDSVYLSKDPLFDAKDLYLGERYSFSLLPGSRYTRSATLPLLNTGLAGQNYLLFRTNSSDYSNVVETSHANNLLALPITLSLNGPDLQLLAASAPSSASVGTSINLSWTVKNVGSATAAETWYDVLYLSEDTLFDDDDRQLVQLNVYKRSPLAAGASYTEEAKVQIPTIATAGRKFLIFRTNPYVYMQAEVSNINNDLIIPIDLDLNGPDLQIVAATAPSAASVGSLISVSWTVKNGGLASADGEWYDGVYLSENAIYDDSDKSVNTQRISPAAPLAVGANYTQSAVFSIPGLGAAGTKHLIFRANRDSSQGEISLANNDFSLPIAYDLNGPDLKLVSATAPATASVGTKFTVSWTVANVGAAAANGDWYDEVYLSDDSVLDEDKDNRLYSEDIASQSPLAVGASYTIQKQTQLALPSNLSAGQKYLIFSTNRSTSQGEISQANNTFVQPITLDLNGPDLQLLSASAPATASVGSKFNVAWTVKNVGVAAADSDWNDYLYLSDDPLYDDADLYVAYEAIASQSPLAAGASYTIQNRSISLPTSASVGQKYLIFRANPYSEQGETSRANNDLALAITVDRNGPDLKLLSASAPATSSIGSKFNVTWTVKNVGQASADEDWSDYIYLSNDAIFDDSDIYLANEFISSPTPLAAGAGYTQTRSLSVSGIATAGVKYLIFRANPYSGQGEDSKSNNDLALPIAFDLNGPDLQLLSASAPATASVGSRVSVSWTVKNVGVASAEGDWFDQIYLSDDGVYGNGDIAIASEWTDSKTPLAAGASYTQSRLLTLPTSTVGNKYLIFRANPTYGPSFPPDQGELSLSNNDLALPITLDLNGPDLQLLSASAPATASIGTKLAVSWTVSNVGAASAEGDWDDIVYLSEDARYDPGDLRLANETIAAQTPLAAGASYTIQNRSIVLPSTATAGQKYLVFLANGFFGQGETSRTNNELALPISLDLNGPDLQLVSASAPATASIGGAVNVSWTVKNGGAATATEDWSDEIYLSDDAIFGFNDSFLSSERIASQTPLAAGASYTVQNRSIFLPTSTAVGQKFLIFRTNSYAEQGETSTANNTLAVPISLNRPDLQLLSASAPAKVVVGSSINVSWTVRNVGAASATGDWQDYVYLSDDAVYDFSDTYIASESIASQTPLAAGDSYTIQNRSISLPSSAEGQKYLLFRASPFADQLESTKVNNDLVLPISITRPDLQLVAATAPAAASVGASINVSWTVKNNGEVPADDDWYDRVYLSQDAKYDPEPSPGVYVDRLLTSEFISAQTPLVAGGSYTIANRGISLPNEFGAGQYYLLFRARPLADQFEANRINNDLALPITLNAPDLKLVSVTSPFNASLGERIKVSWNVENVGTVPAETDWVDSVFLSNDLINDAGDTLLFSQAVTSPQVPLLPGMGYASQDVEIILPSSSDAAGGRYLFFRTNTESSLVEASAANNSMVKWITLNAPDLQVLSAAAPRAAGVGSQISVSWKVMNSGDGTAYGQWGDALFLSDDAVYDEGDVLLAVSTTPREIPLDLGASYAVRDFAIELPSSLEPGEKFLLFRANAFGQQLEIGRADNNLAVPITITAAPPVIASDIDHQDLNVSGEAFNARMTLGQAGDESFLIAHGIDGSSIDFGGRLSSTNNTASIQAQVTSLGAQSEAIGANNSYLWLRPGDDVLTIDALISGAGPGRSVAVRNSFLSGNRGDDIITLNGDYWGVRAVVFGGDGNDRITCNGIGLDSFIQAGSGDDFVSVGRLVATPGAQPLPRQRGGTFTPSCIRGGAGMDVLQLRDTTQAQFQAEATPLTGPEGGWLFRGWQISGFETFQFA